MIPEKKAEKLLLNFLPIIGGWDEEDAIVASKCALILVKEIIKETKLHDLTCYQHGRTSYWENVKKEIEKL